MDKYKRLLSNTMLFGISVFSSKILVFLLMPFYTKILSPADTAFAQQILKSGNLLIPLVSIGIANAVIRFGLDKQHRKSAVFTTGLFAIGIGFLASLFFYPLISLVPSLDGYVPLMYTFVLVSVLRNLCSQFIRAKGFVRLYAIDGIINTFVYSFCLIWFLAVLEWGIVGFVLATVVADAVSAILLFTIADLHRYIRITPSLKHTFNSMVRYSIPLIPTTMFWWIINTCDHFFLLYMASGTEAGLYSTAAAIPHLIMLFSTLFTEAWQLSAVQDGGIGASRDKFFSKVFVNFQGVLFIIATGLIGFCRVLLAILTDADYQDGWVFIPILVIALVYSCFVTFMGSIYSVEKKSVLSFITLMVGAIINVVLNYLLVPLYGGSGAGFATFTSFFVVFVIRAINTKKYIKMKIYPLKLFINTVLLFVQSYIVISEMENWIWYTAAIMAIVIGINIKALLVSALKLLKR